MKEMMDELDKNFGGSRQIVTSVLNEIDNMKIPTKDEQFIENIEKIQKIKRDLEAVKLSSVLEQESILIKLENLLTDKIKDMWLLKAEDKGLLKKNTPSAFLWSFLKGARIWQTGLLLLMRLYLLISKVSTVLSLPHFLLAQVCLLTGLLEKK